MIRTAATLIAAAVAIAALYFGAQALMSLASDPDFVRLIGGLS
jgi:uncharacterized membrane protein YidH (DUF202 family)